MVIVDRFLDPAIYRSGRDVTVAGEVQGAVLRRLRGINYSTMAAVGNICLSKTIFMHELCPTLRLPLLPAGVAVSRLPLLSPEDGHFCDKLDLILADHLRCLCEMGGGHRVVVAAWTDYQQSHRIGFFSRLPSRFTIWA